MTYGIQHPKSRSKALRAYPCEPCGRAAYCRYERSTVKFRSLAMRLLREAAKGRKV